VPQCHIAGDANWRAPNIVRQVVPSGRVSDGERTLAKLQTGPPFA